MITKFPLMSLPWSKKATTVGALLLIIAVLEVNVFHSVNATLLSSSTVEYCVKTDKISCNKKIVLTLAVKSGQNGTESVQAYFTNASDNTSNKSNTIGTVSKPWTISVSASQTKYFYPTTYFQTFNSLLSETLIYTNNVGISGNACFASPADSTPTCGWRMNYDGSRVPDSQGFCCSCSFLDSISDTINLSRANASRGNLNCSILTAFKGSMSASCLTYSNLWYRSYQISNPITHNTFTITITKPQTNDENDYTQVSTTLVLSTLGRLIASDNSNKDGNTPMVAEMIGSFTPVVGTLDLSNKYLFIPTTPANDPKVLEGHKGWMLIDKSNVDPTGLQCNKIGTSDTAFVRQPNACTVPAGSCLFSPLDVFYKEDKAKRDKGQIGDYFVNNFGDFQGITVQDQKGTAAGNVGISFLSKNIINSVIVLTLSADSIEFVKNVGTGKILSATISTFESQSKSGILNVNLMGYIVQAEFGVSVESCSAGILGIPTAYVTLIPLNSQKVEFKIYTTFSTASLSYCSVILVDAMGSEVDRKRVHFNTTVTVTVSGPQGGNGAGGTNITIINNTGSSCSSDCPLFLNAYCFVIHGCWSKLGTLVGIIVALLILIPVIKVLWSKGVIRRICCLPCGSKNKKDRKINCESEDSLDNREVQHSQNPSSIIYISDVEKGASTAKHQPRRESSKLLTKINVEMTDVQAQSNPMHDDEDLVLNQTQISTDSPTLSFSELATAANDKTMLYFNAMVTSKNIASSESFSIRGHIKWLNRNNDNSGVPLLTSTFVFFIDSQCNIQKMQYDPALRMYTPVIASNRNPCRLQATSVRTEMTPRVARKVLSTVPRYPCLNLPHTITTPHKKLNHPWY